MARKFTHKDVVGLVEAANRLPVEIPDFARGNQIIRAGERSNRAARITGAFAPVLDEIDFENRCESIAPAYRKQFAETARTLAAFTMATHLRQSGLNGLKQEASLSGVDLPVFTRQLLMTVTRVYPQLFTLQLFGIIPMMGPTARVHFKDILYDSNLTGTPAITIGDRDDDLTKWNPNFYAAPEGQAANKLRETWNAMTVTAADYRVLSEWSDSYADDSTNVYGEDVDASQANARARGMARVVDRNMVTALINAIPSANKVTFTAKPTSAPNYASLTPSEKLSYDEGIWRDGVLNAIHQIRIKRAFNQDAEPTWGICGNDFALAIARLSMFKPVQVNTAEIEIQRGAMRDLGTLETSGIRFLVDPMLSISSSTNVCIFGHKPMERGAAGLYWLPYINMQPTRDLYDPNIGQITKGVRSRFAICQPDAGVAASSQLGDVYGQLTVN